MSHEDGFNDVAILQLNRKFGGTLIGACGSRLNCSGQSNEFAIGGCEVIKKGFG